MKKIFFTVLVLFIFLVGKAQDKGSEKLNASTVSAETAKLAIVTLRIINKNAKYAVSIEHVSIIHTNKKFVTEDTGSITENDFVCTILDQNKSSLNNIRIPQPLKIRYEYPNTDGTIGARLVELNENEVLIRFNYTSGMKYLQITKQDKNNKLTLLATLSLPSQD